MTNNHAASSGAGYESDETVDYSQNLATASVDRLIF